MMTGRYMCGFCITGNHEDCRGDVVYNEIALSCGCECFCRTIEYTDEIRDRMIEEFYGR